MRIRCTQIFLAVTFIVYLALFYSTAVVAQTSPDTKSSLQNRLNELQWKNRVLILYSPQFNHTTFAKQKSILEKAQVGLQEREIVGLELTPPNVDTKSLLYARKNFGVNENEFKLILIGKDGTEKYISPNAVAAEVLFSVIDAMPMRKSEMKQAKKTP